MFHAYLDNHEFVYFFVKVGFCWKPQKTLQVIQTTTSAISTCNPQISAAASLKDLYKQIRVFDKFFSNRRVFHVGKSHMSKMMGPEMVNMACRCILPCKKGLEWNNHTPHDGTSSIILPCLGWIWPHCNLNSAVFGESSWKKVTINSDRFIVKEFNRIHPDWCLQLVGWMKRWQ